MKFSELNMKVGARIQLQVQGNDYKTYQCEARLLGFRVGGSILAILVEKPPQVIFLEDTEVTAKLAVSAGLVDFNTRVEKICEEPYRYLHLSYPKQIKLVPLRREARFKFAGQFSMSAETSIGVRLDDIKGNFLDISLKGAQISAAKKMGDIVTRLELVTDITLGENTQQLKLFAEIKRDFGEDPENAEQFIYGVSFVDMDAQQQMALMALCYELNAATNFF